MSISEFVPLIVAIGGLGTLVGIITKYLLDVLKLKKATERESFNEAIESFKAIIARQGDEIEGMRGEINRLYDQHQDCLKENIRLSFEVDDTKELARQLGRGLVSAVITVNEMGVIIDWRPGATTLFGWTLEEAIGKDVYFITPPRYRHKHSAAFQKARNTKTLPDGTTTVQAHALTKSGEEIPVAINPSGFMDEQGNIFFTADIRLRTQ